MHLTGFMDFTGQFQDTFCGGGFTGVYVGKNTDISIFG